MKASFLMLSIVLATLFLAGCTGQSGSSNQAPTSPPASQPLTQKSADQAQPTPETSVQTSDQVTGQNQIQEQPAQPPTPPPQPAPTAKYPSFSTPNVAPGTILSPKEGVFPTRDEIGLVNRVYLEKNDWGDYSKPYAGSCRILNCWGADLIDKSTAGFEYNCVLATDQSLSAEGYPVRTCVLVFDSESSASSYYGGKIAATKTNKNAPLDLGISLGNEDWAYKASAPNYVGRQEYSVYFRRNNVVVHTSVDLEGTEASRGDTSVLKYLANLVDYKLASQSG